ncbi:hypothetical protein C0J52_03326 [Blattella germanica]|nr:hypothetical protein C0J52_03326 [Blattella germanica]
MVSTVTDTANELKGVSKTNRENVDFETAISLTGFGKFNILLMLVAIPSAWSTVFDTTTMSYVLPSAECDLNLSNFNKGVLNSVVYAGMISSAFLWGFLSDTFGRWKLLFAGYFLLATIMILSSFSQVFWVLTIFKFFGGFIACGPFAILLTFLAEFNGSHHRARIMMMVGIFTALAIVTLPGLAWLILPQPWSWTLFNGTITFNSWRVFLVVAAIPSLLGGIGICFFDESPKFLMSQGRTEEALKVFRRVYSINTGNPPEMYPVISLVRERPRSASILMTAEGDSHKTSFLTLLKQGTKQMKPFFFKPHVGKALLVFTIQFGGLWGMNTIRLWLPQLFAIVEEYILLNERTSANSTITLCTMLAMRTGGKVVNETVVVEDASCVPVLVGNSMYLYSIIVGASTALFNMSASSIITCVGKKKILVVGYLLSAGCVVAMYWSMNMEMLLVLASLFVGSGSMCTNALMSVVDNSCKLDNDDWTNWCSDRKSNFSCISGNQLFSTILPYWWHHIFMLQFNISTSKNNWKSTGIEF